MWNAASVGQTTPSIANPDACDQDVEYAKLLIRERTRVEVAEQKLRRIRQKGDEQDDGRNCQPSKFVVRHLRGRPVFGMGGSQRC